MIFVWTFHWKSVYLHCFQRGSRTDYSTAPLRLSRCTATTQALHPNDELSAPLLDDSVPCISNPPRPPPVLPEGRRMPSGCISIRFRFRFIFLVYAGSAFGIDLMINYKLRRPPSGKATPKWTWFLRLLRASVDAKIRKRAKQQE